jgi:hypothetical protein
LPAALGFSKSFVLLSVVSTITVFLGSVSLATVGEASGLSVLADRPLATFQTAAGLSLWTTLLALPAARGLARLWVRREVRIEGNSVEILRHTPLGIARRSIPLSDYQGIAHNIRASLSGLTHEIVLVHPHNDLCVTLLSGDDVTGQTLDDCKSLLGLPEIPARAIYERGTRRGAPEVSTAFCSARA